MTEPNHDPLAETSESLEGFRAFAKDAKSLAVWMATLLVTIPAADYALQIGPNWPSSMFVRTACSCVVGVVLMLCFLLFDWKRRSQARYGILMAAALGFTVFSGVAYLVLHSLFVHSIEDQNIIFTAGLQVLPEIEQLQAESPTTLSPIILMEKFHDVDSIWTPGSLVLTRLGLLLAWSAGWASLTMAIGIFVISQWKKNDVRS